MCSAERQREAGVHNMLGDSPVTERVGAMGLHSLLLGVQDSLPGRKEKMLLSLVASFLLRHLCV